DDPVVSWEAWNIPPLAIARADNNIFRLAQRIPFPGKRTLAGEVAERQADALRHDADAVGLDAVTLAKRAYVHLWLAHRSLDGIQRDAALTERVARLVEQRYATAAVSQADVLRAQIEMSHTASETRTAALAIDAARAELNAVMSAPPDTALGTPDDFGP